MGKFIRCGATFELANGEYVSPCYLKKNHYGDHEGSCLGSRTKWPQGFASEYEIYLEEQRQDAQDWKNRSIEDMPEVISPDELKEWTDKVWQGVFDYDD